ncbi:MAG: flagellar biosynthesis protein FlhA [Rhodobacteraceae bacterium]|jgi:type III secretion protein V|nr:flagellar biosynthesis protein FlhA [Paracoccaceae bacterium]
MQKFLDAVARAAQQRDVLLVIVFAAILLMMILPLPPFVMDVLITLNISASIIIMLMALQLHSPVHFSTFPSLLLVTTLFRLSISIATTRLILVEGDAGAIVETFGEVMAGGNLIVGLVIFLIITIVQFLVITKGADRVAEVGARFTLDGMPGKQMSVDADVRAGNIDQVDAKQAREMLEREAKLFGAMDGAMKFVKGDAIAGLVITAINLIGGIAIGMAQLGYGFGEALELYAIMTIGDGLVSQIPALLISVSAGTIVTRVTNPQGMDLGTEIAQQITANYRTVILAGGAIALFGFVPGFPTVIFLIVGLSMIGGVYLTVRKAEKANQIGDGDWEKVWSLNEAQCKDAEDRTGVAPTVTVVLPAVIRQFDPKFFYEELCGINDSLEREFGVPMGHWRFMINEEEDGYEIRIKDDVMARGKAWAGWLFVKANASYLHTLGIESTRHFGTYEGVLVNESERERLEAEKIHFWNFLDQIMMDLKRTISANLGMFVGLQSTARMLDRLGRSNPTLVADLRESLSLNQISAVLRFYLQERMPLTSKARIFESILEWGPKKPDPYEVLQYVRVAVGDFITNRYAPDGFLPAVVVAPTLESFIREGFRAADDQRYLIIDSQISATIAAQVKAITNEHYARGKDPVLLTQQDVRRALFNVLQEHGIYMPVLAYQEIQPQTIIYPIGFISPEAPPAIAS